MPGAAGRRDPGRVAGAGGHPIGRLIAHGETEHDDLAAFADERPWEQVDPADDSAVARWLDEHREASTVPWANLGYTITIAADPGMVAVAQPF